MIPSKPLARSLSGLFFWLLPLASFAAPSPPKPAANSAPAPPPDNVEWADDAQDIPTRSLAKDWPAGPLDATAQVVGVSRTEAGATRLRVRVRIVSHAAGPQTVLWSGLRFRLGGQDETPWFFTLPLTALPADLPPGGQAAEEFRLETFHDTPIGKYQIEPLVTSIEAKSNLLQDGGFETAGKQYPRAGADGHAQGWRIPADAGANIQAHAVKSATPYASMAAQIADWSDFDHLVTDNARHVAAQGTGLLEAQNAGARRWRRRSPGCLRESGIWPGRCAGTAACTWTF